MSVCVGRSSPRSAWSTIEAPIATAKAITDYSAIAIVTGAAATPADQTWNTDEATTRSDFVANFVGISEQLKVANVARIPGNSQDNILVVCNEGEFDVVVESATFIIGDYLGPSKAAGNALIDTSFKKVTPIAGACFEVIKTYASATTLVRARVLSQRARSSR